MRVGYVVIASFVLAACGESYIGPPPGGDGAGITGSTSATGAAADTGSTVVAPTGATSTATTVADTSGSTASVADDTGAVATTGDTGTTTAVADDAATTVAADDTTTTAAADDTTSAEPSEPATLVGNTAATTDLDTEASLAAFETTVYPLLRENCSRCHSSDTAQRSPLHSDVDVTTAHDYALNLANLRQPEVSKLVTRLGVEAHNCWSDCASDGEAMRVQIQAWADALGDGGIPTVDVPTYEGEITEDQVLDIITADRATLSAEDSPFIKYTSLHVLANMGATPDDMNTARAGLSKVLNSTARYAPEIVNPVAVDEGFIVYRFDIRDYWAYSTGRGQFGGVNFGGGGGEIQYDADTATTTWDRIIQGNTEVSDDDTQWADMGSPANNAAFYSEYVEVTQLAYTLSRPDVYNTLMNIGFIATVLESELGVNWDNGIGSYEYMTVNDAITINERLMWRAPIPDGYYWRSVDQFSFEEFVPYQNPIPQFTTPDGQLSQIVTTPVDGVDGAQAQANEVIFSMPNGLQGYGIFGAGNQRRVDAFTFVVVDPRDARGGPISDNGFGFGGRSGEGSEWRLLNGASCMGCHSNGMNFAPQDMIPFIEENAASFDAATVDQVRQLYPATEQMDPVIQSDRGAFIAAQQLIQDEMIVGTTDTTLYIEPIQYLFETAQKIHGYRSTISN